MRQARPTMRHVADKAGVSLKTVSRVINDEPGVAPDTADRVNAAIALLGFRRNDLARSLRHGRSSATLGLVIEDVANPFYSAISQAVESVVHELLALDDPPTAIFTGNNRHTIGALRALRGREHEIALVGFDDFELADLLAMPTTVIRHDAARIGAEAAALAFDRLHGSRKPPQRIVVETELVARGSGEVPART